MTIEKGSAYGEPGALPAGGVVVRSDGEAREALEEARRAGRPYPALGVLGGDLCRTLGGTGDEARVRSGGTAFTVDVGMVLADGVLHLFVAHLVARNRTWTKVVAAMNAQWVGPWNLGPRAHPNDGLVDVYEAHLSLADLLKVRARLPSGTHLPHPRVTERRRTAVQVTLPRPFPLWLDGIPAGRARDLSIRVEPDALRVVV